MKRVDSSLIAKLAVVLTLRTLQRSYEDKVHTKPNVYQARGRMVIWQR